MELYHHGIQGQRKGVRNGPPYPLNQETHNEVVKSSGEDNSGKESKVRRLGKSVVDRVKKSRSEKRILKAKKKAKYIKYLKDDELEYLTRRAAKEQELTDLYGKGKKKIKDVTEAEKSTARKLIDSQLQDIGQNAIKPLITGLVSYGLLKSLSNVSKNKALSKVDKQKLKDKVSKDKWVDDQVDEFTRMAFARVNKSKK